MWIPSPSADQNHLAERIHKYYDAVINHTQDVICSYTVDIKSLGPPLKMAGFCGKKTKTKNNLTKLDLVRPFPPSV